MQRDFVEPDGLFGRLGIDLSMYDETRPRLAALLAAARRATASWSCTSRTPRCPDGCSDSPGADPLQHAHARGGAGAAGRRCATRCRARRGTSSCPELEPVPDELVVAKYRSSGFWGTNLELLLRSNGIETVVVGGCTTEGCVESTARDAMFNDHYVVIAEDCVGSDDKAQHEASMLLMRHRFDLAGAEDIAAVLEPRPRGRDGGASQWASSTGGSPSSPARRPASARASPTAFAAEGADVVVADLVDRRTARPRCWTRSAARGREALFVRTDVSDEASVADDGRAQAHRAVRPRRHPGQQRRHLHRVAARGHAGRGLGPGRRHEPARHVPVHPGAHRARCSSAGRRRIINIASQLGQIGGAAVAHYSASKAGVIGADQGPRPRGVHPRRAGQRDRPGPDPDAAAGRRDARSGAAPSSPSCRSAGSARSPRSPRPRSCWRRPTAPTTSARRCRPNGGDVML